VLGSVFSRKRHADLVGLPRVWCKRALSAELSEHLGYEPHQGAARRHCQCAERHDAEDVSDRARAGGDQGSRDRDGSASRNHPQGPAPCSTLFEGFDDKIPARHARGLDGCMTSSRTSTRSTA
jgi:hypothetical protein